MQSAGVVESAIETVPPVPPATLIVSIATNDAVSVSLPAAENVQVAPFPAHEVPVQPAKRKALFGFAVSRMLSPGLAAQVAPEQSPGFVVSAIDTAPPAPPATLTVSTPWKDAVSVSSPPAANVQLAPFPAHDVPDQARKRKPLFGVAVNWMMSPGLAWQVVPEQSSGFVVSAIDAVPPAPPATLTVSIISNEAVSVSPTEAAKLHIAPCPAHDNPAHDPNRKPLAGVAASVMLSPGLAWQVVPEQSPGFVGSAIDTVPPVPPATVIAAVNEAVSVSSPDAAKLQDAPWPSHWPPDQPAKTKPLFGDAVSVIVSLTVALQLSPVHASVAVASAIDTEPPAPAAAVIDGSVPGEAPCAALPPATATIRPTVAATTIGSPLFTPLGSARTWCDPHSDRCQRGHIVTGT